MRKLIAVPKAELDKIVAESKATTESNRALNPKAPGRKRSQILIESSAQFPLE